MSPAQKLIPSGVGDCYSVSRRDPTIRAGRWALTAPLRYYLRRFPVKRGKGLVHRMVMRTCMSEPENLDVRLPCGACLGISTGEVIGQCLAIHGEFESAELNACSRLSVPGTAAFDVGANVGIYTLTMAVAVGSTGRVFAFEPLRHNYTRLNENIGRNGLENVETVFAAAGASSGLAEFETGGDPAYVAIRGVAGTNAAGTDTVVVRTLDEIWQEAGRPLVSFVKIDVEGAEPAVITGASEMLAASRPNLLVEAPTTELFRQVSGALAVFGLRPTQPAGFERWNYLFER
jgi:FkbM family methyltransferase